MKLKGRDNKGGVLFPAELFLPALYVLILGVVPLLLIIVWSFFEPTEYWIRPRLTIAAYIKFFTLGRYITFLKTLRVSLTVTALALLLGYPIAYFIRKIIEEKYRTLILFIFIIPFFLSYIIRIF